jgi:hypothetical protein
MRGLVPGNGCHGSSCWPAIAVGSLSRTRRPAFGCPSLLLQLTLTPLLLLLLLLQLCQTAAYNPPRTHASTHGVLTAVMRAHFFKLLISCFTAVLAWGVARTAVTRRGRHERVSCTLCARLPLLLLLLLLLLGLLARPKLLLPPPPTSMVVAW